MKKFLESLGWIGLVLLQGQNIPAVMATIQGGAVIPIAMPIMTAAGLAMYLARSIVQKDILYTVGNTIGLLMSFTLIVAILYN